MAVLKAKERSRGIYKTKKLSYYWFCQRFWWRRDRWCKPTEAHGDKKKFEFDGEGYAVEKDLFTAEASTDRRRSRKDFGEFGITKNPGLGLELKLIDGLTINTIVNNKRQADPEKSDFNFVLKGEFAQDIFTVGGGFQSDGENKTSAFGVYGSANPIDDLTVNAEFGSRNLNTGGQWRNHLLLASAEYKLDALTAKAGFLMNDIGFKSLNDDDADQITASTKLQIRACI